MPAEKKYEEIKRLLDSDDKPGTEAYDVYRRTTSVLRRTKKALGRIPRRTESVSDTRNVRISNGVGGSTKVFDPQRLA